MKLINLVISLVMVVLNLLYYIIASPFLIPYGIHKWNKNRKWRNRLEIDDVCFFINVLGKKSEGRITHISDDRKRVGFEMGYSHSWHEVKNLKIV